MTLPFLQGPPDCAVCHGRRHRRTPQGWERCSCTRAVVSQQYIKPALRGTELTYPGDLDMQDPLPLTTSLHAGNWDAFRRMAWRSLITYEPEGLSYDVLSLARLIDIDFKREDGAASGYSSLAYLEEIHLVILQIHAATPAHKWTGYVLTHLLNTRRDSGKPVWVFTHVTGPRLWDLFKQGEDGVIETLKQTFTPAATRVWR